MIGYREIAKLDLSEAHFCMEHNRYRSAVFFFQQFAEKSAKALLEQMDPEHKQLRSYKVERILEAYDETHKTSKIGDMGHYLTRLYASAGFHGDYYSEITEAQALRAKAFAEELEVYFQAEHDAIQKAIASVGTRF